MIKPRPGILDISPYKAGTAECEGCAEVIKLSSNENPLGPPPLARAAYKSCADNLHLYPESSQITLRRAIAKKHSLAVESLICSAGSDELISLLCQAFSSPGDEIIYPEHGFTMYRIAALAAGAKPVAVPEKARHVDCAAILAAVTHRTRIIFISNPASPTATMVDDAALRNLAASLPSEVLLVLDGAYAEYVGDGFDGGAALALDFENVFMLRTFSKFYALAGLRVGWGYGAESIIDILNRVRGPFNIGPGQVAAASAALEDSEFAAFSLQTNTRQRARLEQGLRRLGIESDPSYTNFVLARFESADAAIAADRHLRKDCIITRYTAGFSLPSALRITVGDARMVGAVLDSLHAFQSARGALPAASGAG